MDDDLNDDERAMFDSLNVQYEEPQEPLPRAPPPGREFSPKKQQQVSFEEDDFITNQEKTADNPSFDTSGPSSTGPSTGFASVDDEKADLLNRIQRLVKKGHATQARLSIYSHIDEIRSEYKRISYSIEVEQSVRFQKRMLIACVSGIEFLNKKFDPFDVELDGWSENVMESQDDYDTVFEELFQKYQNKVKVAPEIKLMFMVSGSALMFHMNKTMFKSFKNVSKASPIANIFNPPAVQSSTPTNGSGRREVRGPGIDLSSLSAGGMDISSLLRQMPETDEGSVSDIVSIGSELKDVPYSSDRPKKTRKSKKNEVAL